MRVNRDNYEQYTQMIQQMMNGGSEQQKELAKCHYGDYSRRNIPVNITFPKPNWNELMTKREKPAMSEEEFDEAIKELARKDFASGRKDSKAYRSLCMKHGETVSPDRKRMYEEGMRRTGGKMNASLAFWDAKGNMMLAYNPVSGNWNHISTEAEFAKAREFTAKYIEESKRLEATYGVTARGRITYKQICKDLGQSAGEQESNIGGSVDCWV